MHPVLVALSLALHPPAPAALCVAPPVAKRLPFGYGERLEYAIDSLGATIGTLRLSVVPGPPKAPLEIEARGETGTFAANFYSVKAVAKSELSPAFAVKSYEEDATEKGVHRTLDLAFPPETGRLLVQESVEGRSHDYRLNAADDTRDLLATLYAVRAMPLRDGDGLCLPVFAAHRVWTVRAKVVGREQAHTPAGDFRTVHLAGTATLVGNPRVERDVQFWLSDDASRLPVAACGTVQNKPVCANLTSYQRGRR